MKKERIAPLMKKSIFIVAIMTNCMFLAQSCEPLEQTAQRPNQRPEMNYMISLSSVECPENAKDQFGETKVSMFYEGDEERYHYEDDYIDIIWYVGKKEFNFILTNKANHTIKINWDDVSFVDINGNVSRMMHSGVKYDERNNSQPATSIPKRTTLTDLLQPTNNVEYVSGYGWVTTPLIPQAYRYGGADGKTFMVFMPIMIENVQNDYTFEFVIKTQPNTSSLTPPEKIDNNDKQLAIRFPETLSPAYNAFRTSSIYNMSKKDKALTEQTFISEIEHDLNKATSWEDLEIINTKIKYLDQYSAIQNGLTDTVKLLKDTLNKHVTNFAE